MSLILLRNRRLPKAPIQKDYAIWDQSALDQDEGPAEQKKKVNTVENQLGFLIRKTWRAPIPVGTVVQYAGTNAPIGWLFCDGASLSINDYLDLYDIIGTTYGGYDDIFNVPDFRKRVPVGFDSSYSNTDTLTDLSLNALGTLGGELEHTLATSEMPSHNHDISDNGHLHTGTTDINGAHTHTINLNGWDNQDFSAADGQAPTADANNFIRTYTTSTEGAHSHTFTTNTSTTGITIKNKGGGQAHNIMQPYVVINYIIKF